MRKISGQIVIPSDCPIINGAKILIEVRDVSRADAPSIVVAHSQLVDVNLQPNDRIPFSLDVPEVSESQSLNLRIHISLAGDFDIKSGDLLTTRSYPVPSRGSSHVSVLVKRI